MLRSEWNFHISKKYRSFELKFWTKPNPLKISNEQIHGENGAAFIANERMKPLMQKLQKQHNFNLLASQIISLHRSLPDLRFPECHGLSYPDQLPTTSIIIIFHNEAWSLLMRTIWSIVNRSPRQLIEEIILVDDFSTEHDLKRPLDNYIGNFSVPIKVIRNAKREGLIRSRLFGAKSAKVKYFFQQKKPFGCDCDQK